MFSGPVPLGIPDVNTHVGSVIHAFETMALERNSKESGEKPYESSNSSISKRSMKDGFHKINLPPQMASTGTSMEPNLKKIVTHRKNRAPEAPTTVKMSSTTQTVRATGDSLNNSNNENDSSNLDSLNMDEDYRRATFGNNVTKTTTTTVKNYKVFPPFVQPRTASKIPTKSQKNGPARNLVRSGNVSGNRTDVFLNRSIGNFNEEEIENDFLRGSTVSQSFVKQTPLRKKSTYEQNFLIDDEKLSNVLNVTNMNLANVSRRDRLGVNRSTRDKRSRSTSAHVPPFSDEVSLRYKEYNSNNDLASIRNSARSMKTFKPRFNNRAEI